MYRILLTLFIICLLRIQFSSTSERRFSPFRSAFRISPNQILARNNDDDFAESHATLLPSATRSKPLQTTPFNMATTRKKIISTLLEMTENEISKKLNQLDSNVENNEVLSSNNKRFKSEQSTTTLATERSDTATTSLFEIKTKESSKATTTSESTTSKPRKTIKITTSSSHDALAAAEAAAAMIANMHSMHFGASNKNFNRVLNTATSKIPVHHHNPYDYQHDKINFDVNYRPTEVPPAQQVSSAPAKKSKDKNRESVKNLFNGLVTFVSSPLFNQAKPLIISSFSTVSNALSANKNAISSLSSSNSLSGASSSAGSAGVSNTGVISKMFNSLRTFAVLRRNEANSNTSKNSKKKGKFNSAINNQSSNNNNLSNQSLMMNILDTLIKTREALLSMNLLQVPNKQSKPVNKLSSSQSSKNSTPKPSSYSNYLNLFRLLWKQPTLKQEARTI